MCHAIYDEFNRVNDFENYKKFKPYALMYNSDHWYLNVDVPILHIGYRNAFEWCDKHVKKWWSCKADRFIFCDGDDRFAFEIFYKRAMNFNMVATHILAPSICRNYAVLVADTDAHFEIHFGDKNITSEQFVEMFKWCDQYTHLEWCCSSSAFYFMDLTDATMFKLMATS